MTGGAGVIPITILQDQMDDDGETIVLTLTAANGYAVGTQGSTTITITDDDGTTPPPSTLPVVSITGGGGVSEGEEASFTVTATPAPAPGATISVNVRIQRQRRLRQQWPDRLTLHHHRCQRHRQLHRHH